MKKQISEKLYLEEIMEEALKTKKASKNVSMGTLIKMIRSQLGMSQACLAKRSHVPQPTISHIEKGEKNISLALLRKVLDALYCDLIVLPILRQPIETIRQNQARHKTKEQLKYLKGTMNMENQQPDPRFLEKLLVEEEKRLLQKFSSELWD